MIMKQEIKALIEKFGITVIAKCMVQPIRCGGCSYTDDGKLIYFIGGKNVSEEELEVLSYSYYRKKAVVGIDLYKKNSEEFLDWLLDHEEDAPNIAATMIYHWSDPDVAKFVNFLSEEEISPSPMLVDQMKRLIVSENKDITMSAACYLFFNSRKDYEDALELPLVHDKLIRGYSVIFQ